MKKYICLFVLCFLFTSITSARPVIGDKASGFILSDLNDSKNSLNTILLSDKPVIISFFATWCQPCLKEIPHLQNLQKKTDATIYLINIDNLSKEKIAEFVKNNNITLPIMLDPDAKITGENYGVLKAGKASIPKLIMLSSSGIVKYIKDGYDENIETILEEKILAVEKESLNRPKELAIFFTNSLNGQVESCDCPRNPFGGLSRRATLLKQQRAKYPNNLLLDSGDLFSYYPSSNSVAGILKIYEILNYDAVGIGDIEFSYADFIKTIDKYKVPFLASNINYCEGDICRFITPHDKIIEKQNLKIKIISIIYPDIFGLYPETILKNLKILTVDDVLTQDKKDCDLLILISHAGYDVDRTLAEKFRNIDVIIGGHSQTLLGNPTKIGNTLIVQAGDNGKYVGKLLLKFDESKKIISFENELTPLTKEIPDDSEVKNLIAEYHLSHKNTAAGAVGAIDTPTGGPHRIGR
ncbi:MAG: redoxin domain-containing protein [Elusimicrobia bacterium]|nr:redoxin domain-containing protein [Elusimicrobiota bacterium]